MCARIKQDKTGCLLAGVFRGRGEAKWCRAGVITVVIPDLLSWPQLRTTKPSFPQNCSLQSVLHQDINKNSRLHYSKSKKKA